MIESPWLFITSLIISSIWFVISCFDVIPCSPAILVGCLAFTLATAFAYWIHASNTCVGADGQPKSRSRVNQKAPWSKGSHQSKKPNWFKRLWNKIKDWLSPSDKHPETEGIIIVQRDPKTKFLGSKSELGFTPDTVEEDESPLDAAQRSVTDKTALKPKDLKIVPNFSKEAVIEKTDPEGNSQPTNVTFLLAEISPETKVSNDSKWLTPEEAMEQFPEMKPVITACNRELNEPNKSKSSNYDTKPRSSGVKDGECWYRDPEDRYLIWRVLNKDAKTVKIGKRNPCFKQMVITAIISIISTLLLVGAVYALLHFFPDIFTQIWGGIVQAVTSVFDAIKKLFGK